LTAQALPLHSVSSIWILTDVDEVLDRHASLDLELRILGSSEGQSPRSLHDCRRYEPSAPIASQDKEMVDLGWIESLCDSTPTLVPAIGLNADGPSLMAVRRRDSVGGCLHLNANQPVFDFGYQVHVGTVAEWNPNECPFARQPLHCRELA
jgi:hypothetical protein